MFFTKSKGIVKVTIGISVRAVHDISRRNGILLMDDILLYNSIINVYINCGDVDRSHSIFCFIVDPVSRD